MNSKPMANNKISTTNICSGGKFLMQISGPHSLNEDGTAIPFEEQMAIVSHYLHNQGHKYAIPYKKKAEELIDIYNKQQEKPETHCVSDVCGHYSLFSDLFAISVAGRSARSVPAGI